MVHGGPVGDQRREARPGNARRVRISLQLGSVLLAVFTLFLATGCSDSEPETKPRPSGGADEEAGSTTTSRPVLELPTRSRTVPPSKTTCDDDSNPTDAEDPHVLDREPPTPEPPPAGTPADALESTTLIEGDDESVTCGDTIVVHYVGVLADGTVFDSSWEREPFPVTIGVGQVIEGWDRGLIGAQLGERRHLLIGSGNAYGSAGAGGVIPPDAPLAFDVDIISISR
jgi:peptidylprolyl isomerase